MTSKEYEREIVKFHKEVVTLLSSEKQLGKKFENHSTKL